MYLSQTLSLLLCRKNGASRRPKRSAIWVVSALLLTSCGGDGRKPVFPVTGTVLYDGKPAAGALVIFHPVGEAGADTAKPRGNVGPDGRFTLTTYAAADGAPAGDYEVTIEWWLANVRNGAADDRPPTNRLPTRYARSEASGLKARVESGPNQLQPFVLKR